MDSLTRSIPDDIGGVISKWASCEKCVLAANRKRPILPVGSRRPLVAFVLDRVSGRSVVTGDLLSGTLSGVLGKMLGDAGVDPEDAWLTPNTLCPSVGISPTKRFSDGGLDILPASPSGAKACRGRVQEELHVLAPEIAVCFGATSLRSVFFGNPPTHASVLGKVVEGEIQGDTARYKIPVMATYSLHSVYVDSLKRSGIWNKTIDHIRDAVSVAKTMEGHNG